MPRTELACRETHGCNGDDNDDDTSTTRNKQQSERRAASEWRQTDGHSEPVEKERRSGGEEGAGGRLRAGVMQVAVAAAGGVLRMVRGGAGRGR